ncbi:MAG TPA: hypothetical protein VIN04_05615 [Myxococcota bacterium]
MSLGIALDETMSGHLTIDGKQVPFRFTIRAYTTRMFSLTAPREFRGTAELDGVQVPVRGTLTIELSGPRYEGDLEHPQFGALHFAGKKNYSAKPSKLLASLVTCPLTVYRDGERVGEGEVAYRDSKLAFPFRALRLVDDSRAFASST